MLYNGLKKKGKKIGVACTSSVNLYNQLTSQFDALSKQNALEVPKNFEMAQDIKKLCDSEMKNMDKKQVKNVEEWTKHFKTTDYMNN